MNTLNRNNVHVEGNSGPVLLYAHGFGCNQTMWNRVTPAFSSTHKQVLLTMLAVVSQIWPHSM